VALPTALDPRQARHVTRRRIPIAIYLQLILPLLVTVRVVLLFVCDLMVDKAWSDSLPLCTMGMEWVLSPCAQWAWTDFLPLCTMLLP
jgi:hypothetical protein